MDILFSVVLGLHVLAAVFWAGSTFVLARTNGKGAGELFGPQMGAATLAGLAGVYLWFAVFGAGPGNMVLGFGALCAVIAAGVQGALVGRNRTKIASDAEAQAQAGLAQRIAAALLAVTLLTMVIK